MVVVVWVVAWVVCINRLKADKAGNSRSLLAAAIFFMPWKVIAWVTYFKGRLLARKPRRVRLVSYLIASAVLPEVHPRRRDQLPPSGAGYLPIAPGLTV